MDTDIILDELSRFNDIEEFIKYDKVNRGFYDCAQYTGEFMELYKDG